MQTKFSELTLERGGSLSCDDFQHLGGDGWPDLINSDNGVKIWGDFQHLKMMVNTIKTIEQQLMSREKILEDELSIIMLNQVELQRDGSTMSAHTTGLAHDSHKEVESNHGYRSNTLQNLCAGQNALIFLVEEFASELVRHFFSSCCLAEESSSAQDI